MKKILLLLLLNVVIGTVKSQTVVYTENFDSPPYQVATSGCSTPNWFIDSTLFKSAPKSYRDTLGVGTTGYQVCFETAPFSTVGVANLQLEFDHICKIFPADSGVIEISIDGGINWTRLAPTNYLSTSGFTSTGIFNSSSYGSSIWYPTILDTIPDSSWFRHEQFNIYNLSANSSNVKLRFKIIPQMPSAGNRKHYGWVLDNIIVQGTQCLGCQPHFYYIQDSINHNQFTFYDTTTYLATPTTDSWSVNGVIIGSGDTITTTLTNPPSPGASNYVCRIVSVPGCDSTCVISCTSVIVPGVNISYFSFDTTAIHCTAPDSIKFFAWGYVSGYNFGDTLTAYINFDDGSDTTVLLKNFQTSVYLNIAHWYQNPGTYVPQLILYSPDSLYSDTMLVNHPVYIYNTCGPVNGTVYLDNNSNCIYDSTDVPLSYRLVQITDGGSITLYTHTDSNGVYSFNVPSGSNYIVTVDTTADWNSGKYHTVCPVGGSLTVSAIPSSNNNFYLTCSSGFDLGAYLSAWRLVPGRLGNICVYPFDKDCGLPNGQVKVLLDTTLVRPLPSPHYSINGDTVIFTISGLDYYHSYCIDIRTDTLATIGDSVCVTTFIEPIIGDNNPSNNIVSRCWAVRASWDPNDKSVSPEGVGANHAVLPSAEFTYTIRFQDTGNASAQNIFILDTLDANLDLGTLEIEAVSHTMIPTILSGNILRFSFPNINLPDSVSDEPNSHGYVVYRIQPVHAVANGTVIENTAGIYFDYNPPVITNTVYNTIDIFLSSTNQTKQQGGMLIYPNPAKDVVYIRLDGTGKAEAVIYDVTGRQVLHQYMDREAAIDVSKLSKGVYKIRVIHNNQQYHASMVIMH